MAQNDYDDESIYLFFSGFKVHTAGYEGNEFGANSENDVRSSTDGVKLRMDLLGPHCRASRSSAT